MDWKKLLSEKRIRDFFIEPQPLPREHRSQFERDYDRAIFCTPVRRMHDKAQVFPLEPNDSVRTRLTHSLEVSTVARDMARHLGDWLEKKGEIDEEGEHAIETIAATCGLIHDLGNPPFGHAGETAVRDWFREREGELMGYVGADSQLKKDFLEFEGNAQTLRLVSKLQILADMYGLNFTCGTMSAACKYVSPSDALNEEYHELSKVGYFASEEMLMLLIRDETGTGQSRNPITFIAEAADDIVYSAVDLEDGVKKGVVNWKTLVGELRKEFRAEIRKKGGGISAKRAKMLEECIEGAKRIIKKKGRVGLKEMSEDEALAQAFRVCAISHSVKAVLEAYKESYQRIMSGTYHGELYKDSDAFFLIEACKNVGLKRIYRAEQNLKLEVMGKHVIHDLMDVFWEGALKGPKKRKGFEHKIFSLMSENYRTVFRSGTKKQTVLGKYCKFVEKNVRRKKLPKEYCCMQLVTDYICGMTDTFACTLHRQLKNG